MAPTAALVVQVIATATIPVVVLGVIVSRLSRGRALEWRHAKMAALLSLAPVLVVLTARGVLTRWAALIAVLVVIALGLLAGSRRR